MLGQVQVQVVLYDTPATAAIRLVDAVAATARDARDRGLVGEVFLRFGDSSEQPLRDDEIRAVQARMAEIDVSYLHFGANLGSAGGSNRLAEGSTADAIWVLNPDTYPSPTALGTLLEVLADDTVGIAEARQLPLEHPKEFDLVRGDTSWASGGTMLVRRTVFEDVGGFDDDHFFLYCDDVDLSWRVRLSGKRVVHVPAATVFHDKRINRQGQPEPTETEGYYGVLGRLMLAHKYGRPDVASATVRWVTLAGTPGQRRALEDYRARRSSGALPDPIPRCEDVAQFIDGEYARHRF